MIAGLPCVSARYPTSENLPAGASPVLNKLATAYICWYLKETGKEVPGSFVPILEGVRQSDGSLPPFPTVQQIPGALVSRNSLVEYLKTIGFKSAYEFDLSLREKSAVKSLLEKTRPAEERPQLKKSALIARLEREWPTIEADLKEAARNGLIVARVPEKKGWYYSEEARQWAEARGKLRTSSVTMLSASPFPTTKTVHHLKG